MLSGGLKISPPTNKCEHFIRRPSCSDLLLAAIKGVDPAGILLISRSYLTQTRCILQMLEICHAMR